MTNFPNTTSKKTRTKSNRKLPLNGLAKTLVSEQLIDELSAQEALDQAKNQKVSFIMYLVKNQLLAAKKIAEVASKSFGVPLFNLDAIDKDFIPYKLVHERLIQEHHVLPLLKRGNNLYLAIADPNQQKAFNEIKFHTGLNIHALLVEVDKLNKLTEEVLNEQETLIFENLGNDLENLEIASDEKDLSGDEDNSALNDAPIIQFANKVLIDAINKSASDVHCEPYEKDYRIRFRIDGVLYEVLHPPLKLANRITSRFKVMSKLDISERRIPQDGRFKMKISNKRSVDFRVSTCPTIAGEKVVMRILDPTNSHIGIDSLGFNAAQKEIFLKNIKLPQGMVLVTGPTGSGKTVSLYTALNILNTAEKNISTAEDPVEIYVEGINQVEINTKTGLTFAAALRSFLRQDPDIIMVGEMRDLETAEIGIKAAQTGHLVLSTLHTNSAPDTLCRLVNMGVAAFNIATSVSLIVAQRLTRRLCEHCKTLIQIPPETLLQEGFKKTELNDLEIYGPVGCDACTNGYKGRIGLYEMLQMNDHIGQMIMSGSNSLDIAKAARDNGMVTLRESGLEKIKTGITSLEEINRVTKD